ncbi:hypothetical protein E1287_20220 [Actinomadura sp. KC06]|uniref:hypothetical protein n=1 Tax=Actinomadura sp. KC06 TaxID=2530369 RepID=UPI00105006FF|nr:hypothetical protein [Actinomadura sp. KC06]TDD33154.1 hypothetical protein E1287_20220 [Actinomadura sp. KC06]
MRRTRRHTAWPLTIPTFALLLAGCADDEPDKAAPASSPLPATTRPASPRPTPTLPKAKNGKSLSACADARCEVAVGVGDTIDFNARVTRRAGVGDLTIKEIGSNTITYAMLSGDVSFGQPKLDMPSNVNGAFSLTLIATAGNTAVIRVGPPKRNAFEVIVE